MVNWGEPCKLTIASEARIVSNERRFKDNVRHSRRGLYVCEQILRVNGSENRDFLHNFLCVTDKYTYEADRMTRKNISSGAPWESIVGYSRAVCVGRHVYIAGTTATDANGHVVGADDAAKQTRFIIEKIEVALMQAGASLNDVVRTRLFVTDIANWELVGRVHGEYFSKIRPASTMMEVSRLIDPAHLVEIEADAYIAG